MNKFNGDVHIHSFQYEYEDKYENIAIIAGNTVNEKGEKTPILITMPSKEFKQFIKTNSQLTIPFWANIKENKIQPVTFN